MSFSGPRAAVRLAQTHVRVQSTIAVTPTPSTSAPIFAQSEKAVTPPSSKSRTRSAIPKPAILPSNAMAKHTPLPLKTGVHVATLHFRSHTTSLEDLTFFTSFALRAAKALALPTSGVIALPTKTSLFTVPRSPFAHKKSQENFWRKEHKRAIKVYDGNEEIVEIWLAYLRKEAMGGVGMKAQTFRYKEVGYGQKMVTSDGLRHTALLDDSSSVQALAQELISELTIVADSTEAEIVPPPRRQEAKESDIIEITTTEVEEIVEESVQAAVEVAEAVFETVADPVASPVEVKAVEEPASTPVVETVEQVIEVAVETVQKVQAAVVDAVVPAEEVKAVEQVASKPAEVTRVADTAPAAVEPVVEPEVAAEPVQVKIVEEVEIKLESAVEPVGSVAVPDISEITSAAVDAVPTSVKTSSTPMETAAAPAQPTVEAPVETKVAEEKKSS